MQRVLIEKAGNDYGFEYSPPAESDAVNLASARHRAQVRVALNDGRFVLIFSSPEKECKAFFFPCNQILNFDAWE